MEARQNPKLRPSALLKPKKLKKLDPDHAIVPEIVKYILTFTEGPKKKTFGAEKYLVQCEYVSRLGFRFNHIAECWNQGIDPDNMEEWFDSVLEDNGLPKQFFHGFRSRIRGLCDVILLPPMNNLLLELHKEMDEELHTTERPFSWLNRLRMAAVTSSRQIPSADQMDLNEPETPSSESSAPVATPVSAPISDTFHVPVSDVTPHLVIPSAPRIDMSVQLFDVSTFSEGTQSFWKEGPGATTFTSAVTVAILEKLQEHVKVIIWEWMLRRWPAKARQFGWSCNKDVDPQSIEDLVLDPATRTEAVSKYDANFEQCKGCIIYPKLVKSFLARQSWQEPEQRKGMRTNILREVVLHTLRFARLHGSNVAELEKLAFIFVQVDAAHKIMSKKRLEVQRSLVFGLQTMKEMTARSLWGPEEEKLCKRAQDGVVEQDAATCQQLYEIIAQPGDVSSHWYNMLDEDLKIKKKGH